MPRQLTEIQISNAEWFIDTCISLYGHGAGGVPRKMEYYREQYYRNLIHLCKTVHRK